MEFPTYTIKEIIQLVKGFRAAIEKCKQDFRNNSEWFGSFPLGCCGDTTDLLMFYLKQNGIKSKYVNGSNGVQTHAWLKIDSLIIDITADQFSEVNESVLITTDSSWHIQFNDLRYRESYFDEFDEFSKSRLMKLYVEIVNNIR